MYNPKENGNIILDHMKDIPRNSSIFLVDGPFAWIYYIDVSQKHQFFLVVDKRVHIQDFEGIKKHKQEPENE